MKKIILFVVFLAFTASSMFSQITVLQKELKKAPQTEKELNALIKEYEFLGETSEGAFMVYVNGFTTEVINLPGTYMVIARLKIDWSKSQALSKKSVSLIFYDGDLELDPPEKGSSGVSVHYTLSQLDFITDQLNAGDCTMIYVYESGLSILKSNL